MERPVSALVFGGAFNPPTRAHIELAEAALRATGRERVVFVPSKSRYIEHDQGKDYAFTEQERLAMLRACAAARPWMTVSDWEILAPSQPRTYHTLCALRSQGIQGAMLIGSDKLRELGGGWLYVPEIAKEFGIVCMRRGEDDCAALIAGDPVLAPLASHIQVIETPAALRGVSSTEVRRLLREKQEIEERLCALLPEELCGSLMGRQTPERRAEKAER